MANIFGDENYSDEEEARFNIKIGLFNKIKILTK